MSYDLTSDLLYMSYDLTSDLSYMSYDITSGLSYIKPIHEPNHSSRDCLSEEESG